MLEGETTNISIVYKCTAVVLHHILVEKQETSGKQTKQAFSYLHLSVGTETNHALTKKFQQLLALSHLQDYFYLFRP